MMLKDIVTCKTAEEAVEMAKAISREYMTKIREMKPLANGAEGLLYEYYVGTITCLAREWYFSLADVGTSEEELQALGKKHCLSSARTSLAYIRLEPIQRNDNRKVGADCIREEARKGGFALADIGTSEAELTELSVRLPELKTA